VLPVTPSLSPVSPAWIAEAGASETGVGTCAEALSAAPDAVDLSLGVPDELLADHVSDEVRDRLEAAVSTLEAAGATVERVSVPTVADAVYVWNAVTNVEIVAALRRRSLPLDRPGPYDLARLDATAASQSARGVGFGDVARERALVGAVLLDRYDGRHYTRARNACAQVADEFAAALDGHDALVAPTMPVVAPELGAKKPHSYGDDDGLDVPLAFNTRPADLAGVPAVTVPDGGDGLPVGVQFVAGRCEDRTALQVARTFEQVRDA
jgi:amidase/aspartyl-tRNA(Asn)/glutamyl-tRNA(Gln) amidotransferase subunit A